jgi:hypothetical protein
MLLFPMGSYGEYFSGFSFCPGGEVWLISAASSGANGFEDASPISQSVFDFFWDRNLYFPTEVRWESRGDDTPASISASKPISFFIK